MHREVVVFGTGALLVLCLSVFVPLRGQAPQSPASRPAPELAPALEKIATQLANLVQALERDSRGAESRPQAAPESRPRAEPPVGTAGAAGTAVRVPVEDPRTAGQVSRLAHQVHIESRPEDIARYIELAKVDRVAAARQIQLRTMDELLAMFGAPEGVGVSKEGRMRWLYRDVASGHEFTVTFVDGLSASY